MTQGIAREFLTKAHCRTCTYTRETASTRLRRYASRRPQPRGKVPFLTRDPLIRGDGVPCVRVALSRASALGIKGNPRASVKQKEDRLRV